MEFSLLILGGFLTFLVITLFVMASATDSFESSGNSLAAIAILPVYAIAMMCRNVYLFVGFMIFIMSALLLFR